MLKGRRKYTKTMLEKILDKGPEAEPEVIPKKEEEEGSGYAINREGRVVTPTEAAEEKKKGLETEGWREQK